MTDWSETLCRPTTPIRRIIEIIDGNGYQIALVVGDAGELIGSVTDGDVRRGLLRGVSLEDSVVTVMNDHPTGAHIDTPPEKIAEIMSQRVIRQVPLLDDRGVVSGLAHVDMLHNRNRVRDNPVFILAGGLGNRLRPLTNDVPKPMIEIGGKPLLESIIDRFVSFGFHDFTISVNYMSEIIIDHFGDGAGRGIDITYAKESAPLGTAGSLRLLPSRPDVPMVVMNGDVLTRVDFGHLLDFHTEMNSTATMAVREYDFQVPYGVVQTKDSHIVAIDEKPVHSFFVNAGIYVLSPEVLDLLPKAGPYDMTTLFEDVAGRGLARTAFPVREYWLDVGQHDDLDQARREINNID